MKHKRYYLLTVIDWSNSLWQWLCNEALRNNPKIEASADGTRFNFKPTYKLKDGKSLMKLLKQHDNKGLGGVLLDDIQESLPHFEKTMKHRSGDITFITRPTDKKKIAFYHDRGVNLTVSITYIMLCTSFAFILSLNCNLYCISVLVV